MTSGGVRADARGEALARYYDLDLQDDPGDLDLYLALAARASGPILELACGTGRLCVPLAEEGHEVTGIDIDPDMLARARRRWADAQKSDGGTIGTLELVEADLLEADLGGRFALVFLALNSLLLLADEQRQRAALAAAARHLAPGGRAIVDVWLPAPHELATYDDRLSLEWIRHDEERDERVMKQASASHDSATSAVVLRAIFDAWPVEGGAVRRVDRLDQLRLIGAAELATLARDAGIRVERLGGDYSLTPFGPGAERAVLLGALL